MFRELINKRKLKGKWHFKQIDEPDIKGYIVQGRLWSDQPLKPFDPFKPPNPWQRRPMPQRPFRTPETLNGIREPFVDVFDEDKSVNIYFELPGEEKDDLQLNVTEDGVEVKAKNFYKTVNVPRNVDIEKVSSKYTNGVLTVIIPKKERSPRKNIRKIKIE